MTEPQLVAIPSTLRWTGEPVPFNPQRPNWQAEAACLGANPDLWFPERGEDVLAAKAVCAECPVKQECLDYALETHQIHGIWGGLSERQRRQIRGRRPKPAPQRDLVHRMAAQGATATTIADELGISTTSVYRHLRNAAS